KVNIRSLHDALPISTHAKIAQDIKHAMMQGRNWANLPPYMKESLEMIAQKAGRILNGDPRHEDSWDDIAGYAKLSADAIRDEKEDRKSTRLNSSHVK